jgi:signal transduction histidine kinase
LYKTFHKNPEARGIGLFITKNQVEAMGGKIQVTSEPGVGTIFTVSFEKVNSQDSPL